MRKIDNTFWIIAFTTLLIPVLFSRNIGAAPPLDDAVALWHMGDENDSNGKPSALRAFGEVEFGTAISPDEQEESQRRGGDGKVVRIPRNGYLYADQGAEGELNIQGKTLSIYIRMQIPSGNWDFPIFSKHGGHNRLAYNIYSSRDRIGCEIGTTGNNRMLSASVPFSELLPPGEGARAWHDIICRVDGAKLELFVDGRCVDEEFMIGELRTNDEPFLIGAEATGSGQKSGFEGLIDHAAIWDRALNDEEILFLSGGKEKADQRERTDRGIPGESLQYWRPPNNYYVGDCMPFYDPQKGVFHFVYLLDKGHHGAKGGYGAHQWAQATSTDLVHWEHQPLLLPITEQWEGSICTGSLFLHDGIYYAFYATRAVRDVQAPNGNTYEGEFVAYATSTDGIHFTKQEPNPLVMLPQSAGYSRAGRDPVVFQDERDKLFHMYITSDYRGQGCWAHLTSKDLKSWELQKPVLSGGGTPECPDWFKWGDTYYLIINWGNGYYRVSNTPVGPWEKPGAPDILMPGAPRVPKTAAFRDGRRIICGWTNENGFGGHAVFHELIRRPDGTLGEKFVPEMIPATGKPIVSEDNSLLGNHTFSDLPANYRLQLELEFDPAKAESLKEWSMVYYQDASNRNGIRLVPSERTAYLGQTRIEQVDYSSGKISLDLIVQNRVVDLCINEARTITGTIPTFPYRELTLRNPPPEYQLKKILISPLVDQPRD
ncbi:MAG: hypothetical protein FWC50_02885 [Planctomycetaceae bacterium]|nr:hypothetical protein [Planctomycetaceae bacterium]